jgi:hypothetical protein
MPVFKTGAFNRSATPPGLRRIDASRFARGRRVLWRAPRDRTARTSSGTSL